MKKAAFFVEGQTELIFVRKLLEEIAGAKNIAFREEAQSRKTFHVLRSDIVDQQEYFALILDCCADNAVASSLLDQYASLKNSGYELIVGLRDLYPLTHADIPRVKTGITSILPKSPPQSHIVVAIAEVEAWFMQENLHFPKIDKNCNHATILANLQYDIENDLAEQLSQPAKNLDEAYRVAGKRYTKSKKHVSRTINALDIAHLYVDRRNKLNSFDEFVNLIENFLT